MYQTGAFAIKKVRGVQTMTSQMKEATTATDTSQVAEFDRILRNLDEVTRGQVLISQDRCVDALLDLYNSAPTEVVRSLIASILDEVRHVSAVRADGIKSHIDELAAAAAVESAFFG